METKIKYIWSQALRIGLTTEMETGQQMRLHVLNAFLAISLVLTIAIILLFLMTGSYSVLEGLAIVPVVLSVFYLNHRRQYRLGRFVVTYGLMLVLLGMALADRRAGTEYLLIAIGCSSVIIFDNLVAILSSFVFACICYAVYVQVDSTLPFTPDPTIPYFAASTALMFVSGFVVLSQSLVFRFFINKYQLSLKGANDEIHDVNEEMKSSNEELRSLSEKLNDLVHEKSAELQAHRDAINVNLFSITTDWQGHIITVNEPLIAATGYSREELAGQNFTALNSDPHDDQLIEQLLERVHSAKNWRGEVKCKTKVGASLWVDMVIIPVPGQFEEPPYLLMLALPITERKVLEEENLEALKALESVTFHTSHEIKGPLARIIGLTNLLTQDAVSHDEIDYVSRKLIESSSELEMATHDLTAFVTNHPIKTLNGKSVTE